MNAADCRHSIKSGLHDNSTMTAEDIASIEPLRGRRLASVGRHGDDFWRLAIFRTNADPDGEFRLARRQWSIPAW
jgi:hypothetical protein